MTRISGKLYAGFSALLLLFALVVISSYAVLSNFTRVSGSINDQTHALATTAEFSRSVDLLTQAVLRYALSRSTQDLDTVTHQVETVRQRADHLTIQFSAKGETSRVERVRSEIKQMDNLLPLVLKRLEVDTETAEVLFYGVGEIPQALLPLQGAVAATAHQTAGVLVHSLAETSEAFILAALRYFGSRLNGDLVAFQAREDALSQDLAAARVLLQDQPRRERRLLRFLIRDIDIVKNSIAQLHGAKTGYEESMRQFYAFAADVRAFAQEARLVEEARQADVLASFSDEAEGAAGRALLIGAIAVAAALAVAGLLGRGISTPLRSMTRAMQGLANGDLEIEIPSADRRDEVGDMARAVTVFRDNAREVERLQKIKEMADEEVAERRARFRAIVDNAPGGISLKDIDGRYLLVNKKFEDLVGVSSDDVIGRTPDEVFDGKAVADSIDHDQKVIETGDVVARQERFGSGANARDYLTTKFPVFGRTHEVAAVGTIRVDITDQKRTENALNQAKVRAEEANAAKDLFLANVSHELRTPLTAIIGYSKLMASGVIGKPENDQYTQYAERIHSSGEHLLALINDILDVSVITVGAVKLNETEVDVSEAVTAALEMVAPRADEKNQTLHVQVSDETHKLTADDRFFRQILVNLLANAVKFTPDDGDIRLFSELDDTGAVRVRVEDTGIGIAPEDIPKVLEAFGQAETDIRHRSEGTGIGLTLSKKLMESHGGTLEIESELGSGTQVTCTFPPGRTVRAVTA